MALSTVSRAFLVVSLTVVICWAGGTGTLFKKARKAEESGRYLEAYLLYSQARASDPNRERLIWAAEGVRERAVRMLAAAGGNQAALLPQAAAGILAQPDAPAAAEMARPIGAAEVEQARLMRPPVEVRPDRKVTDFKLNTTLQEAYETVAREFGLDVLFDSDYQGSQSIRFELSGCDFQQAILALNDVADSFIVPVSPKLFLVAADNEQKRTELEPVIALLIPIPDAMTPEDVTQLAQAVQQSLDIQRLQVDTTRRQVFVRDTVTRVRMAEALLEHLAKPKAELLLDVELLSVSDGSRLNLGLGLPSAFPIENLSTIWNNQPSVADTAATLLGIGGGKTIFGLAVGSASLVANKVVSEARLVSRFRVRASHGMPASLHVGERFPIINARFSPILVNEEIQDSIDSGEFVEPFPSFTFEDLGLVLEFTPQVHSAREVTLDLQVQFRLLTGSTANDIPIIANRELNSLVRLTDGEFAMISGIAMAQNFSLRSGVALLSDIPWLGNLFSRYTKEKLVSDLIVLVRPHIVRLPPAELAPSLTLRHGPEARPLSGI